MSKYKFEQPYQINNINMDQNIFDFLVVDLDFDPASLVSSNGQSCSAKIR